MAAGSKSVHLLFPYRPVITAYLMMNDGMVDPYPAKHAGCFHGTQALLNCYFESYYTSLFNYDIVLENVLLLYLHVANLLQHDSSNIRNIIHPFRIWLKLMIL